MLYFQTDLATQPQFDNCGRFFSRKAFKHVKRKIDSFDIIFGCSDNLYMSQNNKNHVVGPDNYILLMPGYEHAGYAYTPPGLHCYWMHFYLPESAYVVSDHPPDPDSQALVSIPEFGTLTSNGRVSQFFHQLMDMSLIDDVYRQNTCNHFVSLMLMQLSKESDGTQDAPGIALGKLYNVREWIRVHATDDISLEEIARTFGYNPQYLSHKFKQTTGETIFSYINRLRMKKAKELLITSSITVEDVSMCCGFSNAKYFMRLFKRLEDATPSQYRAAFIKENINRE